MSSFHRTSYLLNIGTSEQEIKAGDVLRVFEFGAPFGDAVILGFDDEGNAKLTRPYVYAHGVGTTGPTPLLGSEVYTLYPRDLAHYVRRYGILQRDKIT